MTKIKDLVTVSVDSIYRAFPVDVERYELVRQLQVNAVLLFQEAYVAARSSKDERVNQWVSAQVENFTHAASALWHVNFQEETAPAVYFDRARRIPPAIANSHTTAGWSLFDEADYTRSVVVALLWELASRLSNTDRSESRASPKDRR